MKIVKDHTYHYYVGDYITFWFGPGKFEAKKEFILGGFMSFAVGKSTRRIYKSNRLGRYSHSLVIVKNTAEFGMFMLKYHALLNELIAARDDIELMSVDAKIDVLANDYWKNPACARH